MPCPALILLHMVQERLVFAGGDKVGCSFRYLALGDSITVGAGAPPGKGYVDLIARKLMEQHPQLCMKKIARQGMLSGHLLLRLFYLPCATETVRKAQLITLYIGGNDLSLAYLKYRLVGNMSVYHQAIYQYSLHLQTLLQYLRFQASAPIFIFNLYNPFPRDPLARHFIHLFNERLAKLSDSWSVPVIDVFTAFEGRQQELISGYKSGSLDGYIPFLPQNPIHPNLYGHQLIAHLCLEQMKREMVSH